MDRFLRSLRPARVATLAALVLLATSVPSLGADSASGERALADGLSTIFKIATDNVLAAAEEMPEASFGFRPTPDVRTFGELVGHIADSQRGLCALAATGQPAPDPEWEKKLTSKRELVEALKTSTNECTAILAAATDRDLAKKVRFAGRELPAAAVISFVSGHSSLHYGNLSTYLRIRGLVPPSSQGN